MSWTGFTASNLPILSPRVLEDENYLYKTEEKQMQMQVTIRHFAALHFCFSKSESCLHHHLHQQMIVPDGWVPRCTIMNLTAKDMMDTQSNTKKNIKLISNE